MVLSFRLRRQLLVSGACLLIIGFSSPTFAIEQLRAVWADAFHEGFKSTSQIDDLVNRCLEGRYNAIVAEVMAYQDSGSGHGAYWISSILPKASDIDRNLSDPLSYLCERAHSSGIEVHCWLVPFRVSTTWPPGGNSTLTGHPEWLSVPLGNMGSGPAGVNDGGGSLFYMLDPGCPAVQDYLLSIVRELVTNYPVDGIHYDYIRYTTPDAGYPANSTYEYSGLKRFQRITGYSGIPATDYSPWNDFRRREINEIISRTRTEIPSIRTNPRQPVRFSASVFATGGAPYSFYSTAAYARFQNWELWMRNGWLDTTFPMNYKEEHCSQGAMFRSWVDAAIRWRYNRQTVCGQANYQNTFENSIIQMRYALDAGSNGVSNYCYVATRVAEAVCDPASITDWGWYSYLGANLYTATAAVPAMPWRNPATATEGTIWGRVKDFDTGKYLDNIAVTVDGLTPVYTDGNGYYVVTLVPATAGGTTYNVNANKAGTIVNKSVSAKAGDVARCDLGFSLQVPVMMVSPVYIDRATRPGRNPLPDTFEIWNANTGEMQFEINEQTSWLSLSTTSGSSVGPNDKKTITITYNTLNPLLCGDPSSMCQDYSPITINAPTSSNGSVLVSVLLTVGQPGDLDHDFDTDLDDLGKFQLCLTGSGVTPANDCIEADLDGDNDVDKTDITKFINCLSGADIFGNPACAD